MGVSSVWTVQYSTAQYSLCLTSEFRFHFTLYDSHGKPSWNKLLSKYQDNHDNHDNWLFRNLKGPENPYIWPPMYGFNIEIPYKIDTLILREGFCLILVI